MLSVLFRLIQAMRRAPPSGRTDKPIVIAVGSLVVGGAGKTPAVIALAREALALGKAVGIISRGYKSAAEHGPGLLIDPKQLAKTPPEQAGDEPWLIAWHTGAMVAVCKDRAKGLDFLLRANPSIELVLLDDGLSQRSLAWTKSVLVLDERGFGNEHCLPYGPLREPVGSLRRFDAWIDNGFSRSPHQLERFKHQLPDHHASLVHEEAAWVPAAHWQTASQWIGLEEGISIFSRKQILAVAGIAVPQRFFDLLSRLGIGHTTLAAEDHDTELVKKVLHACALKAYDAVLMTEKDAVKFFFEQPRLACPIYALRRKSSIETSFVKGLIDGS